MGTKMRVSFLLTFFIILFQKGFIACDDIQCLANDKSKIEWFIVYKIPNSYDFIYMDSGNPNWISANTNMYSKDHAVYHTLNQIYSTLPTDNRDYMYAMYNDSPPKKKEPSPPKKPKHEEAPVNTGSFGHVKGVVSFDHTSGFWMIHSTPKFPSFKTSNYEWPDSAHKFGQTFLCVSFPISSIDDVGKQLRRIVPYIYDKKMPNTFENYTEMYEAVSGGPFFIKIKPIGNSVFTSIAKSAIANIDIYKALADKMEDSVSVETWRRDTNRNDKMASDCHGQYKVENIKELKLPNSKGQFGFTNDHAKWAVTQIKNSICIGDLNRMESQKIRAGGLMCVENADAAKNFRNMIHDLEKCP